MLSVAVLMRTLLFGSFGLLALPVLLLGYHFALARFARVPVPLLNHGDRTRAVGVGTLVLTYLGGLCLCYGTCVAAFFLAYVVHPTEPTLLLDPVSGSGAEAAGVQHGDRAVSLDGRPVTSFDELRQRVYAADETLEIEIEREGVRRTLTVTRNAEGAIGVRPILESTPPGVAFERASTMPAKAMLSGISWVFGGRDDPAAISGPVAVVKATSDRGTLLVFISVMMSSTLLYVSLAYAVALGFDQRARALLARSSPTPR